MFEYLIDLQYGNKKTEIIYKNYNLIKIKKRELIKKLEFRAHLINLMNQFFLFNCFQESYYKLFN